MGVILKNLKGCIKAWQCSSSREVDISFLNIKQANGKMLTGIYGVKTNNAPLNGLVDSPLMSESANQSGGGMHYIGFGTGDTPVTEEDYKLQYLIESGIKYVSINSGNGLTVSEEDGVIKKKMVYDITYQNTSELERTIKEVGLYYCISPSMNGWSHPTLIHREVLAEPMKVVAGNYFTIHMEIETSFSM